ncbi:DUF333 domain-containing protein [Candidatus Uhrbacteria bacterium]|nr:DUF333 domain-containing protein [Candidatus Uhrbacteria bacterium]
MKTFQKFSVIAAVLGSSILVLAGAGCSSATEPTAEKPTTIQPTATEPSAGLANPASVKCKDDGLGFRMGENEYGQYGVCIFDDKSECEEWAYFRGECEKGDCKKWEGCPKMLPGGK